MQTIEAAGAPIAFGDAGSGAPVLALHGSASSGAMWRSLVGYLGGRFRVLTPDLPGYGASGIPDAPGPLEAELAAVAALVEHAGQPVHLVGHAFGGAVALEAARRMPGRVRTLTVIEPTAFQLLDRSHAGDRSLAQEIDSLAELARAEHAWDEPEGAMRRLVDYFNGRGAWARSSGGLRAFLLGCLPRTLHNLAAIRALPRQDYAGVACPTLAVMGLDSPVPSLRVTELLGRVIPGAELRLIPDAGHMVPLTDPHLLDPMIAQHLLRPAARALALAS
jgi:pimeloyl-ACP methyl ester carboxylesterase